MSSVIDNEFQKCDCIDVYLKGNLKETLKNPKEYSRKKLVRYLRGKYGNVNFAIEFRNNDGSIKKHIIASTEYQKAFNARKKNSNNNESIDMQEDLKPILNSLDNTLKVVTELLTASNKKDQMIQDLVKQNSAMPETIKSIYENHIKTIQDIYKEIEESGEGNSNISELIGQFMALKNNLPGQS